MAIQIPAVPRLGVPLDLNGTLTNVGPGSLYYRDEEPVSASTKDGTLASGSSLTVAGTIWLVADSSGCSVVTASSTTTSGGGHTIQDEAVDLTARTKLNFTGAGVTATDNSGTGATDITIGGVTSTTKRVTQPIHQPGSTLLTSNVYDLCTRNLFCLPFTTTRWRLRLRNCSQRGVVALPSNAISITGVAVGKAVLPVNGLAWNGAMSNVATALSSLAVPAGGAEYTSAWVTATNAQFTANTMHAVSIGSVAASGTGAYIGGPGLSIRGTGSAGEAASNYAATAALSTFVDSATVFGTYPNESYYDVRIEYEFATSTNTLVGLVVGDSLSVGTEDATETDSIGMAQTHGTWPGAVMHRNGCAIVNIGQGASLAQEWQDLTYSWWTDRVDITTTVPDFAIVYLGSNDINNNASAATTIARLANVANWIRGTLGIPRVFGCTVPPRAITAGKETARVALNVILGEQTNGYVGIFDFDWLLRSPGDFTILASDVKSGGDIHPNTLGNQRMASLITLHQA